MKEVINVVARDGFELSAACFVPDKPLGAVVLINAATGVKQTFYADFAAWLSTQGFHVYTFDYRGIGDSRPDDLRDLLFDMHDWSKDVDALISHITRVHPQSKLAVLGHSVGGQLIGMASLTRRADAFMMIGSQTPYWKNYKGLWMRIKLFLFWHVTIPVFTRVSGYFPASRLGLFEDLPAQVAKQWARWAKSRDYIFEELPGERASFEVLNQPALMVSFTDDALAPHKAVLDLKRFYKSLKLDHWHLHPDDILQKKIGHFGFFKKKMEVVLWREVVSWLHKSLASPRKKAA